MRVALVAARFNEFIVGKLIEGPVDALVRHGAASDDIVTSSGSPAPSRSRRWRGAWPTPASSTPSICLGAVIRGGTDHYQFVAAEAAKGIAQVAHGKPPCR